MYIPQDVVDLIIDQLALILAVVGPSEHRRCLQATSLVSTPWVNASQRHLFSAIKFDNSPSVRGWHSRIKPDPYGVSRHVRVLRLWIRPLSSGILETVLPHLTSLRNLQELDMSPTPYMDYISIYCAPLEVLTPIFSSLAGNLNLKRLRWAQINTTQETWRNLYVLANLLPNLMDLDLLTFRDSLILPAALPRIRLSPGGEPPDPAAFNHFKFQELEIMDLILPSSPFLEHCQTHLRVLDFWGPGSVPGYAPVSISIERGFILTSLTEDSKNLQMLFGACHALQEVSFYLQAYAGLALGLIPSTSVSLIRIRNLDGVQGSIYNSCWGHSLRALQVYLKEFEQSGMQEYATLGGSIRKIAQRFSNHHRGLKTRVQVIYYPTEQEAQAIDDGEIPFSMTKLEEELGAHLTLELKLLSPSPRLTQSNSHLMIRFVTNLVVFADCPDKP